jgi:hypothetical protein
MACLFLCVLADNGVRRQLGNDVAEMVVILSPQIIVRLEQPADRPVCLRRLLSGQRHTQ